MHASEEVVEAARRSGDALATGDRQELRRLLHPQFRWISHTGERFDRDSYVESTSPVRLDLTDAEVVTHDRTAVLRCEVVDEQARLPMTQVWVRYDDAWVCLAGHTEPALSLGS